MLVQALSRRVSSLQISIIIMETDAPEILSVVNVDVISAGGINLLLSLSSRDSRLVARGDHEDGRVNLRYTGVVFRGSVTLIYPNKENTA